MKFVLQLFIQTGQALVYAANIKIIGAVVQVTFQFPFDPLQGIVNRLDMSGQFHGDFLI